MPDDANFCNQCAWKLPNCKWANIPDDPKLRYLQELLKNPDFKAIFYYGISDEIIKQCQTDENLKNSIWLILGGLLWESCPNDLKKNKKINAVITEGFKNALEFWAKSSMDR